MDMRKELTNNLITAILSCPIVYIRHFHYHLVDSVLEEILFSTDKHTIFDHALSENILEFDLGQGCVVDFRTKTADEDAAGYDDVLTLLRDAVTGKAGNPFLLLVKNCFAFLETVEMQSLLSFFACQYEMGKTDRQSTIILVSAQPVSSIPAEIEKFIKVIDVAKPSMEEIFDMVSEFPVSERYAGVRTDEDVRMELCRTLQGLHAYEIRQILDSSLLKTGMRISPKTKQIALEEKKNIVRKSGIIEVVDADESFDHIGGLEVLKKELRLKASIYRNINEAQKHKVPLPKGVLILGMPGCGKTMIAKSVAREFDCSLLRLDVNRLMGKFVGESESNLRQALATAEAAHPCVLWIDEIEKAFAGSNGQNNDNLVMRLMGHFLTWMQERKTPVFVVATANDVMRPEFMRKGRFDEVYFVDFPNQKERVVILEKTMARYLDNDDSIFDFSAIDEKGWQKVATEMQVESGNTTEGFSGSEIKSVVDIVIEQAFNWYVIKRQEDETFAGPVCIGVEDFIKVVRRMKENVMAKQLICKNSHEKTNIERIREMKTLYSFKSASEQ